MIPYWNYLTICDYIWNKARIINNWSNKEACKKRYKKKKKPFENNIKENLEKISLLLKEDAIIKNKIYYWNFKENKNEKPKK